MTRKLIQSTAVTGGMTLVSRITGLARDVVFAGLIGAGAGVAADAFYVAFRIPNFLRRIFGEGAFSQAFVPVFTEHKTRAAPAETRAFVDHLAGVFGVILFLVTLAGVLAAPLLVMVLAPGFLEQPHKYDLTVQMLRIMFPYLLFISLVAMAAGILNSYGRFGAAAFTPVLLNLCLIGAALWLAPRLDEPVLALAWGVFLAGVVQLLFQIPFLRAVRMLPRPRLRAGHDARGGGGTTPRMAEGGQRREQLPRAASGTAAGDGVGRVFRLMLPAIFGVSVSQLNLLVNTLLASFLVTGSVSWLYYSDRLMEFPLGVFGIALATVILPNLSRQHATRSHAEFSHLLDWGLRWVALIGIPASAALIVLSGPLLATFFHYGAFNAHDVRMSASALTAFSAGLVAFILVKVLAPGFYARQDTKTPVRIGVISMLINIALSLALVFPLKHTGLALAITLAAFVNAALLYRRLRALGIYRPGPGWGSFLLRVLLATAGMTALLAWGAGDLESWLAASARERVIQLAWWVAAGLTAYGGLAVAFGVRPAQLLLHKPGGS